MSCKGMSVTAARQLVDQTCARFKIPLYIFHDFDVSGFSIAKSLHWSNRRFEFTNISGKDFRVVDFGLRLADVERLDLASEPVSFGNVGKAAIRARLRINGAAEREIEFLLTGPGNIGQRVELNAMTSPQFVALLEEKIAEHGVGKVIPSADKLEDAYRLFKRGIRARVIVEEALAAMATEEIATPPTLEGLVRGYLEQNPAASWDEAVEAVVDMTS